MKETVIDISKNFQDTLNIIFVEKLPEDDFNDE